MTRLFSPQDQTVHRIHDQLVYLEKIKRGTAFPVDPVRLLTEDQIAELIETAFWASLRPNEGRATRFCVVAAGRETFLDALAFATPVPYHEGQIVRLAPAVPHGGCILVSVSGGGLNIWGFGRSRAGTWVDSVTIEVSEPGTVRVGVGPFQTFAVLDGRSNSILEGTHIGLPHYLGAVLRKGLPGNDVLEAQAVWRECLVLAILARMIVAEGHGGILLIVPDEKGAWAGDLNPFAYPFARPDTTIRDGIRRELRDSQAQGEMIEQLWQSDLPDDLKHRVAGAVAQGAWYNEQAVRAIASLSGVDGAIVMTRDLRVLGFGAKLAASSPTAQVSLLRPEPGSEPEPCPLRDVGGTRHQSAAQFVGGHRDVVAVVISEDRHTSVMHWDDRSGSVVVVRNAEWWL
jgi:hypothetical protein